MKAVEKLLAETIYKLIGNCDTHCPVYKDCPCTTDVSTHSMDCIPRIVVWAREEVLADCTEHMRVEDMCINLIDNHYGVYIPQIFVENILPRKEWHTTLSDEDIQIFANGPDDEGYWPLWDDVLNRAYHIDESGYKWTLHHDDDLFMVMDGYFEKLEQKES